MLMVSHICLAADGRTLALMTPDVEDSQTLSYVTSCICTILARSLVVVAGQLLPSLEPITLLLLTTPMKMARWWCGRLLGKLLYNPL
jgi:hypothetical protein